jgi:hypothetical protein
MNDAASERSMVEGKPGRRKPTDRWKLSPAQRDHMRGLIGRAGYSERGLAKALDIHDAQLNTLLGGKSVAMALMLDAIAGQIGTAVV